MARGPHADPAPAPARVLPDVLHRYRLKQRPSPVLAAIWQQQQQQRQPHGTGPAGRQAAPAGCPP